MKIPKSYLIPLTQIEQELYTDVRTLKKLKKYGLRIVQISEKKFFMVKEDYEKLKEKGIKYFTEGKFL